MQDTLDNTHDLNRWSLFRDFLEDSQWTLLILKYATRNIKLLFHLFPILLCTLKLCQKHEQSYCVINKRP